MLINLLDVDRDQKVFLEIARLLVLKVPRLEDEVLVLQPYKVCFQEMAQLVKGSGKKNQSVEMEFN